VGAGRCDRPRRGPALLLTSTLSWYPILAGLWRNLERRRETAALARDAPGDSALSGALLRGAASRQEVAWLRAATRLPHLMKDILQPDDARLAAELGVVGVVVSNHGGRSLDNALATAEALPAIAEAVGDRLALLADGGIRRGTDVLKALALGADAFLLGRPQVHGLAVAGAMGVAHVVRLLRDELEIAMGLCGCPDLASIGRELLLPAAG